MENNYHDRNSHIYKLQEIKAKIWDQKRIT